MITKAIQTIESSKRDFIEITRSAARKLQFLKWLKKVLRLW